ncbi:hypothetical protein GP2_026_00130 [Gordonia paraffinivorans NBRC 108238]|uniref:Secreted protein n=2 Tax=Gordonia paraffinivorans TaxID=175628 RepID=A0ABQ0IMI6_9ACTN|nr:hypothetical protein [Gordonia paraffinivorans]PWD43795.1 hypothetical protein ACN93_08225 [Gordonia paraffinivorans]GAC84776.1 hypothetical protein GP2_026_00130 [Gordonia paraffinivorans NBRC 108238]
MPAFAKGPLLYVIALAAIFVIAFGVGRAWGPDPQPATHESPTHGVVETTTVETGGSAPPPAHDDAHHDAGRHGQGGHDQDGGEH